MSLYKKQNYFDLDWVKYLIAHTVSSTYTDKLSVFHMG